MNSPRNPDDLIDMIREGIALDIYAIFEGAETKRLLVEPILVSLITGLTLEYLKGLLRPKEVGEERSKSLGSFIGGARQDKLPAQEALKQQLVSNLVQISEASPDQHEVAIGSFAKDLARAGVPREAAEVISRVIGDAVAKVE